MANKKFWLGMVVLVLALGMTVVGCDIDEDDPSDEYSMDFLPGTVTITGTAYVGQTLTANTDNLGGSGSISYQWYHGNTADMDYSYSTIDMETGKNYSLTEADLGKYIYVHVERPSHYYGNVSDTIGPITAGPPLTGTVSITGTAKVGQTLTVNTGGLDGSGNISYQWKRGDSVGAVNTNITNAIESNYILSSADFGKYVTVNVTRSGHGSNVSSTAIGPIADAMDWVQISNNIFSNSIFKTGNSITYNGSNQWVAVGDGGILAYSTNGEDWTKVDLSTIFTNSYISQEINGVAYGNGKWVAVGGYGKMVSSTDGTSWAETIMTSPNSPFGTRSVNSVVYANNRWVAGGANGVMGTSTDNGVTWTSVTNPFGYNAINSVAYGNNRWVAVGANGKMATSIDGQNWTDIDVTSIFTYTSGSSQTVQSIYTVAYANNQWIAASGYIMATSTNGINWTAITGNPLSTAIIKTVAYGNNKWVAAGGLGILGVGLGPARIAVSTDGKNWSSVINTTFGDNQINSIAFGNNKWVAVGDDSKIAYANDN
jgi:hypothetical protein